jgi:hypothetical protein
MSIAIRSSLSPKTSPSANKYFKESKSKQKRKHEKKEKIRQSIILESIKGKADTFWIGVNAVSSVHIGDPKALLKRLDDIRKPKVREASRR